jgi:predicted transcriptional regulator
MAKNARAERESEDGFDDTAIVEELFAVKRLLMLLLVKIGSSSEEIAEVLEVAPSAVRTAVPSRKVKKLVFGNNKKDEE